MKKNKKRAKAKPQKTSPKKPKKQSQKKLSKKDYSSAIAPQAERMELELFVMPEYKVVQYLMTELKKAEKRGFRNGYVEACKNNLLQRHIEANIDYEIKRSKKGKKKTIEKLIKNFSKEKPLAGPTPTSAWDPHGSTWTVPVGSYGVPRCGYCGYYDCISCNGKTGPDHGRGPSGLW